ncbi:hypothetical protein EVAR_4308_1 [Eumeta japonica]|uniref:Uncharacterized protein n=1 Tax=Eumeta variegata TaxID=151549 RepID=A0A4C1VDY3_EUMVA|nr:hypothetical protein EVAR_4308_1 [Eumeta japonica]
MRIDYATLSPEVFLDRSTLDWLTSEVGSNRSDYTIMRIQYNARNSAAVKFVTKMSQWRKIGTNGGKGRGTTSEYGNHDMPALCPRHSEIACAAPSYLLRLAD